MDKVSQKSPLLVASNDQSSTGSTFDSEHIKDGVNNRTIDDVVHLPDGRKLGFMIHNPQGKRNVIFIPGAGFGRAANPCIYSDPTDKRNILSQLDVCLIIFDKPGYGRSSFLNDNQRSLTKWADDIKYALSGCDEITKHLTAKTKNNNNDKDKENIEDSDSKESNSKQDDKLKIDWMAHSAGCPHLLSIMYYNRDMLMQFESNIAVVSSPNPLQGNVNTGDRPNEKSCERKVQRCCALNCLCCLLCMFKPLIKQWKNDASKFMQFTEKEFLNKQSFKDYQFITNDLQFKKEFFAKMEKDFQSAIGDAVDGKGDEAMRQDMFLVAVNDWGFKIKDISLNNDKFQSQIHVWFGTQDHATPNGDWIFDQLATNNDSKSVFKHKENGHSHGIIHSRFDDILKQLVSS